MDTATLDPVTAWEQSRIQQKATTTAPPVKAKAKVGGLKGFIANLLPTIGGTIGAIGGSFAAPGLGTATGGAAGSGLGEFLKEKLTGENTSIGNIGREALLGAVPGALEGVGAGIKAVRAGGNIAAEGGGNFLSGLIGKGAAGATDRALEEGAVNAGRNKVATLGDNLQKDVINPKVAASVGGAQKEAAIAEEASKLKGFSAKAKYENLQPAMQDITNQITPILDKSTGTVTRKALSATIQDNAESSGHFLSGEPTYERQLKSVMRDISAKTGGTNELTAKQLFDYKKGMDMNSVFTKLSKGADLNPKESARLAVWSSMDDAITAAEPTVKALTQRQSLLMQSAKGLQQNANKVAGIPILGIKSKAAEQVLQGAKTAGGKVLSGAGGSGFLGALTKQGVSRAIGEPLLASDQPAPTDASALDPNAINSAAGLTDTTSTDSTPASPFNQENIQAAILNDIQTTGGKNAATLISLYNTFGKPEKTTAAQQTAADNLNLADSALKSVTQAYVKAGGGQGAPGLATHIPVVGKYLGTPEQSAYNSTKIEAATQLAKALTGAARPASSVIEYYLHSLPNIEDRPEEVAAKLRNLQIDLQNRHDSSNSSNTAPTDLNAILQGA